MTAIVANTAGGRRRSYQGGTVPLTQSSLGRRKNPRNVLKQYPQQHHYQALSREYARTVVHHIAEIKDRRDASPTFNVVEFCCEDSEARHPTTPARACMAHAKRDL
jgi:hypothetical protein